MFSIVLSTFYPHDILNIILCFSESSEHFRKRAPSGQTVTDSTSVSMEGLIVQQRPRADQVKKSITRHGKFLDMCHVKNELTFD